MNSGEDKYKIMLSGYIDGELSSDEKAELEMHLKTCSDCRKELEVFQELKEVTGAMKYADIPEHVWDNYWRGIYRRLELGIGWILDRCHHNFGLHVLRNFSEFLSKSG